jgi:hypothetical protein
VGLQGSSIQAAWSMSKHCVYCEKAIVRKGKGWAHKVDDWSRCNAPSPPGAEPLLPMSMWKKTSKKSIEVYLRELNYDDLEFIKKHLEKSKEFKAWLKAN